MNRNIIVEKTNLSAFGAVTTKDGVYLSADLTGIVNGIFVFDENTEEEIRLDFPEDARFGNRYRVLLKGIDTSNMTYLFHEDGEPVIDPFAKSLTVGRPYGVFAENADENNIIGIELPDYVPEAFRKPAFSSSGKAFEQKNPLLKSLRRCRFPMEAPDTALGNPKHKKPCTPYSESIYYGLHVRGFTADPSSRIKEAGTFSGVTKKMAYLKSLGITGVVFQPIYDFDECEGKKLNYWGYTDGFYLSPKASYAFTDHPEKECRDMIHAFHDGDMEVILQFYFKPEMPVSDIAEVLSFWSDHYHVDGFWLIGAFLNISEIKQHPLMNNIRIWSDSMPVIEPSIVGFGAAKKTSCDPCALVCRSYTSAMRRFLKGDAGSLNSFLNHQRIQSSRMGQIVSMASYDGMRLMDVVSYDFKHNEENGEDNRDGDNNNLSWNCGIEGPTRKKNVLKLRSRQLRNALTLLFTSQGTPMIFMGDEWGKSAGGNNNPYCQDNEITYQKWNLNRQQKEILAFTRRLIRIRKEFPVLHQSEPLRLIDYLGCGFPDISYHGSDAWRPNLDHNSRSIGILLSAAYIDKEKSCDNSLYALYNMHWENYRFSLPKPERGYHYELVLDTDVSEDDSESANTDALQSVILKTGKALCEKNLSGTSETPGISSEGSGELNLSGRNIRSMLKAGRITEADYEELARDAAVYARRMAGTEREPDSILIPGRSIRIYRIVKDS